MEFSTHCQSPNRYIEKKKSNFHHFLSRSVFPIATASFCVSGLNPLFLISSSYPFPLDRTSCTRVLVSNSSLLPSFAKPPLIQSSCSAGSMPMHCACTDHIRGATEQSFWSFFSSFKSVPIAALGSHLYADLWTLATSNICLDFFSLSTCHVLAFIRFRIIFDGSLSFKNKLNVFSLCLCACCLAFLFLPHPALHHFGYSIGFFALPSSIHVFRLFIPLAFVIVGVWHCVHFFSFFFRFESKLFLFCSFGRLFAFTMASILCFLVLALVTSVAHSCQQSCVCDSQQLHATCTRASFYHLPIMLNPELRQLRASHNQIQNLSEMADLYPNLEVLELDHNQIERIHFKQLTGLNQLRVSFLHVCEIYFLPISYLPLVDLQLSHHFNSSVVASLFCRDHTRDHQLLSFPVRVFDGRNRLCLLRSLVHSTKCFGISFQTSKMLFYIATRLSPFLCTFDAVWEWPDDCNKNVACCSCSSRVFFGFAFIHLLQIVARPRSCPAYLCPCNTKRPIRDGHIRSSFWCSSFSFVDHIGKLHEKKSADHFLSSRPPFDLRLSATDPFFFFRSIVCCDSSSSALIYWLPFSTVFFRSHTHTLVLLPRDLYSTFAIFPPKSLISLFDSDRKFSRLLFFSIRSMRMF